MKILICINKKKYDINKRMKKRYELNQIGMQVKKK